MENLKIRVMIEQESKEAQELFFELGYEKGEISRSYPSWISNFHECNGRDLKYTSEPVDHWLIKCKETTLPQLRDMVVLHRNDVRDATDECRTDSEFKYRLINNTWHVITECNPFWRKDSISRDEAPLFIKPIKKDRDMENLISGKEALIALANGKNLQYRFPDGIWLDFTNNLNSNGPSLRVVDLLNDYADFRLKPRTIKIGDIEVPAPFEPKAGSECWVLNETTRSRDGYMLVLCHDVGNNYNFGAWRTESEIKQVVAALRKLMGFEE